MRIIRIFSKVKITHHSLSLSESSTERRRNSAVNGSTPAMSYFFFYGGSLMDVASQTA